MTDKAQFDLDAAFAALEIDERVARPKVSDGLVARVLTDAAEVIAEGAGARLPARSVKARSGGFRLFGLFDAWSGAAIAATALCLIVGAGVGYESGAEVMARAGLDDSVIAFAADDEGFSPFDDVL
jgi:hypothetical protein